MSSSYSLRNYNLEELVVGVGEKYKLVEKIGSGSFDHIYLATNISNANEQVAVKVERKGQEMLLNEHRVYSAVQGVGAPVPQLKWYGPDVRQGFDINILVMELLGNSLEDCFELCDRRFTTKTTLMLADQLLTAVEYLHGKSFIHRDIKPENFLMGVGPNRNKVFMIDFGFAKRYRDQRTRWHIPKSRNNPLIGTARYCSINTHEGKEQSRRDDLESLGYMLIYFLRGSLPWQGLKGANKKQRYNKIMECKISTSIEELCKDIPKEFGTYIFYCRCLKFDERPDYKYLRQLFQILFKRRGYQNDNKFDWADLEEKESKLNPAGPSTA